MTDPRDDEWTDTPEDAPLTDVPGIADNLGPDGGDTPGDLSRPGDGSDEVTTVGQVDPELEGPESPDEPSLDDRIGLAADDEILR